MKVQDGLRPQYTAAELENSAPFDPDRRLRGEAGAVLLDEMRNRIETWERATGARKRARKPDDAASFILTLDTLLANFIALWLNKVDPTRFLAVGFDANVYRLPLSLKAMQALRNMMEAEGLVDVAAGFRKIDAYEHSKTLGRRTRIRPRDPLLTMFEQSGVEHKSIQVVEGRKLNVLRKRQADAGSEPPEVLASVAVLEAVNARLARTHIRLSQETWNSIKWSRERTDDTDAYRAFAGDETAKALRRIFSGNWERGGRIYGGWWMHVPSALRPYLLIDGEPAVEWDYAHLHPSLLFARAGAPLKFDPYTLEDEKSARLRQLGKGTFQRLVNREYDGPMRAAPGDKKLLSGLQFSIYLEMYKRRLSPIQKWFFRGVGMELQREDSDLAVKVLARMEAAGIATLPIHDSFMVAERHSDILKEAMDLSYETRYLTKPTLKKVDAKRI